MTYPKIRLGYLMSRCFKSLSDPLYCNQMQKHELCNLVMTYTASTVSTSDSVIRYLTKGSFQLILQIRRSKYVIEKVR